MLLFPVVELGPGWKAAVINSEAELSFILNNIDNRSFDIVVGGSTNYNEDIFDKVFSHYLTSTLGKLINWKCVYQWCSWFSRVFWKCCTRYYKLGSTSNILWEIHIGN